MNRFILQLENCRPTGILGKLEFLEATGLYIILTIVIMSEDPTKQDSLGGINYLYDLLTITVFYLSFLVLNYIVLPNIRRRELLWLNLGIIVLFIAVSFVFFPHFEYNIPLISFTVYFSFRYLILFLWQRFNIIREEKGGFFSGILLAIFFYILLMAVLIAGGAEYLAIFIPGILIPFSIFLYGYSYQSLIPRAMQKKHPFANYLKKIFLVLFVSAVPLGLISLIMTSDEELPFVLNMINLFLQLVINIPLSWFTYKRHIKGKEEVTTLKKELGQSTAKFDFLRSQINPHFLFNALNTLYGTAIQENAERTGEGIQQLGDMMRFMIYESNATTVTLSVELNYLQDYIGLQQLRYKKTPIVDFQVVGNTETNHIAPLLFIHLLENAYKHSPARLEPGSIKIRVAVNENTLIFNVQNPIGNKRENLMKEPGGIGLANVQKRLQLLYTNQHSLDINITDKVFIVELKINNLKPQVNERKAHLLYN